MPPTLTHTEAQTTADEQLPETYAFDRRHSARHTVSGRVTVQRHDHDPAAYQHPICSVELCDMGHGGMAAVSDVAMAPNELVEIYFPAHGAEQGLDLRGRVVRCIPTHGGYRVAIAFDTQLAA